MYKTVSGDPLAFVPEAGQWIKTVRAHTSCSPTWSRGGCRSPGIEQAVQDVADVSPSRVRRQPVAGDAVRDTAGAEVSAVRASTVSCRSATQPAPGRCAWLGSPPYAGPRLVESSANFSMRWRRPRRSTTAPGGSFRSPTAGRHRPTRTGGPRYPHRRPGHRHRHRRARAVLRPRRPPTHRHLRVGHALHPVRPRRGDPAPPAARRLNLIGRISADRVLLAPAPPPPTDGRGGRPRRHGRRRLWPIHVRVPLQAPPRSISGPPAGRHGRRRGRARVDQLWLVNPALVPWSRR